MANIFYTVAMAIDDKWYDTFDTSMLWKDIRMKYVIDRGCLFDDLYI